MSMTSEFQLDHDLNGWRETLSKLSPFAIHNGIAGGDVTIQRQFNGDLFLTCSKKI